MGATVDAVLEIFTWVGLGAAVLLGLVTVVAWAADGTWLPARAYVDHEDDGAMTLRWFDADGDANSARAGDLEAQQIGAVDRVDIWYRHGWHGRMRLTRRAPVIRLLLWSSAAMAALGVAALVVSWILMFASG